jgi:transcriptional regulator with XRE-family HTH domain
MSVENKGRKYFNAKVTALKNKKPVDLTVGERLILIRIENGFNSQEKFGELFSLSKSTINNYENGTAYPDFYTLKQISEKFNVSYDYLFGFSNSKTRKKHNIVNALGLSEKAVDRLINLGKSKRDASIVNYLLECDQLPAIVELLKGYITATLKASAIISGQNAVIGKENVTSANYYLKGIAGDESVKYALIHCFTDLVECAQEFGEIQRQ